MSRDKWQRGEGKRERERWRAQKRMSNRFFLFYWWWLAMAHWGVVLVVSSAQIIMWGGSWKCHNCFMSPILVVEEQNGDDFLPSENSFANNERVLSSRRLWFILWSVWFWKKAICLIIFYNKMISKSISITLFDYYTIWIELHFCQPFFHKFNKCK